MEDGPGETPGTSQWCMGELLGGNAELFCDTYRWWAKTASGPRTQGKPRG